MGDLTDKIPDKENISKWINDNVTEDVSSRLASKLFQILQAVFQAPYNIVLPIIESARSRKYKKTLILCWTTLGYIVLALGIVFALFFSMSFLPWGIGLVLGSLVIIKSCTMKFTRFEIPGELTKIIIEDLEQLNTIGSVTDETAETSVQVLDFSTIDDDEDELGVDDDDDDDDDFDFNISLKDDITPENLQFELDQITTSLGDVDLEDDYSSTTNNEINIADELARLMDLD